MAKFYVMSQNVLQSGTKCSVRRYSNLPWSRSTRVSVQCIGAYNTPLLITHQEVGGSVLLQPADTRNI